MHMFQQKVPWGLMAIQQTKVFPRGCFTTVVLGGFRWGWFGARRKVTWAKNLRHRSWQVTIPPEAQPTEAGETCQRWLKFCQIQGYTLTEFKSHVRPFSLETWSRHGIEICSLPDMAKDAECPKTQWLDFKTGLWQLEFLLPFFTSDFESVHLVKPYAGMMFLSLLQVAANFWNWRGITELDRKYIYLAISLWPFSDGYVTLWNG